MIAAVRHQLLDADDRGQHQRQLGHDQRLSGEQRECTVRNRNDRAAQQQRNHDVAVVFLVLVAALGGSGALLQLIGGGKLDLWVGLGGFVGGGLDSRKIGIVCFVRSRGTVSQ